MSSPFIAYYTIVPWNSCNLILKCFNTKDMIKYKVLEALSTEVKLPTGQKTDLLKTYLFSNGYGNAVQRFYFSLRAKFGLSMKVAL